MSRQNENRRRMGGGFSNPPSSSILSRMPSYTLIYIPEETGTSRRLMIPKALVLVTVVSLCIIVGGFIAMGLHFSRMRGIAGEYERLKAENHSIRSEAAALVNKLREVQSNLSRVDQFSDEVREAAQMEAKAATKGLSMATQGKKKPKTAAFPPGIGPLTAEEYALSQKPGGIEDAAEAGTTGSAAPTKPLQGAAAVKLENLEFRDLFMQLSDIKVKSSSQLRNLESLLGELQGYRSLIGATPTISPVKEGWVTSLFGRRVSPINGQNRMHQGLDIAAPLGTPIKTAADGVIVRVGNAEDYGRYVEISHGFGVLSRYAHAQSINVKAGDKVKKGDTVGLVGMTGRTTGPHLHYEIEINGKKVDPSYFIRGFR